MKAGEFKVRYSGLISKTEKNPELILTLPFETMVSYITRIGKIGLTNLYSTLKDVAYEKYGEVVICSLILKLEE